jgi:hypothetical protein
MSQPTEDEWKAVRVLLKGALLAEDIPTDSTELRPKAVWKKYKDEDNTDIQCIDYTVKPSREKFTRILRALRKKHSNGDLENEDKPKQIEWGKSAAKQFLKKSFREKDIATDYANAEQVWKDHCDNHLAFAKMKYDNAFKRRLGSVRDDYIKN